MKRVVIIFLFFVCIGFRVDLVSAFDYPLGDDGIPANYLGTIRNAFSNTQQLPPKFDWREEITFPFKNQQCDNCWAFVATGVLESRVQKEWFLSYDFSEEQLISLNSCMNGCNGGNMLSLLYYQTENPKNESYTSFLPYIAEGYYTVNPNNTEHIKRSVLEGPAYFRFNIYTSFGYFWKNGSSGSVYSIPAYEMDNFEGGHAVLLIGWDDLRQAWLCRNSWCGEKTIEKGPNDDCTFWISYHNVAELIYGVANVETVYYYNNPGPAVLDECMDIECYDGSPCCPLQTPLCYPWTCN